MSTKKISVRRVHDIENVFSTLTQAARFFDEPMALSVVREYGRDPYLILITCLLSLRTRDIQTYPVVRKLFAHARTPRQMLAVKPYELEVLFKSLGMYRQKAKVVRSVSEELLKRYSGMVPNNEDDLLSLRGVGRKTANLVLSVGFQKPAICVDVHVHRIANRLGWVHTKTPEQTENALMHLLAKTRWADVNRLLVMWGQHHCKSGACNSACHFKGLCAKVWPKNLKS